MASVSEAPRESLVALLAEPLDPTLAPPAPTRKAAKRDPALPKRKYTKREPAPAKRKYTFIKRKRRGGAEPEPPAPPKRKRTPRAPPEVVGAATRWRMPPPERLLTRIPKAVAAYLELTRPEEYEQFCVARRAEIRRRREIAEREHRLGQWMSEGTELPAHMLREPPAQPRAEVARPEPEIAEKVEKPFARVYKSDCLCASCRRIRYERYKLHDEYVCRMERCRQKFRDVVAFVDHQVDAHATVNVHCKRTREEYFRVVDGTVYAPETVFIVEQYANAMEPPELWTLERVEQEKQSLEERIASLRGCYAAFRNVPKRFIRMSFDAAYERVQLYGLAELREQHRIALEHFEAALVFPVGPRNRQDVISTVRLGRNWLLSPEPENSELARVLKLDKRNDEGEKSKDEESEEEEEEEEEDEVVLLQIGGADKGDNQSVVADLCGKKPANGMSQASKTPATTNILKEHGMLRDIEIPDVICL